MLTQEQQARLENTLRDLSNKHRECEARGHGTIIEFPYNLSRDPLTEPVHGYCTDCGAMVQRFHLTDEEQQQRERYRESLRKPMTI